MPSRKFILYGIFVLMIVPGSFRSAQAAVEKPYSETETSTERTDEGVPMSTHGGSYADIPSDRKVMHIDNNVYKAEDEDRYVHRTLRELREGLEQRIGALEKRVAVNESDIVVLKTKIAALESVPPTEDEPENKTPKKEKPHADQS